MVETIGLGKVYRNRIHSVLGRASLVWRALAFAGPTATSLRSELLIALANGLIYFGLGLWLLRRAYRRIRRLGLLASH